MNRIFSTLAIMNTTSLITTNLQSMQMFFRKILLLICILTGGVLWAQQDTTKTDEIDTQRLIIIKPYSPTVSDAVKIRQKPSQKRDESLFEKKEIEYDIFSVPVASTFSPEKGRASGVKQIRKAKLYDSYAALGIGNYTNLLAEFYTDLEVGDKQRFTIDLQHNSSQGGVKKLTLKGDDKYFNTQFGMGLKSEEDKFFWEGRVGFLHQQYNWYGVFDDVFSQSTLDEINPRHNYIGLSLDGNLEMKNGVFDRADVNFQHFRDDFSSSENRVVLKPKLKFDVNDENFTTDVTVDFLSGKFKNHGLSDHTKYSFLNLGLYPSYNYDYGDLAFTLGAEVFYSSDIEHSKQKFYIHPKIKASYHIAEEFLTAYAGLDGGLNQNSYSSFSQENPYVAPQLAIAPTHTQFDLFVGAKGLLTDELFYDLRAGYKSVKDQALFHANSETFPKANSAFTYNNSFLVLYEDIKTFYFRAGLEYKMDEDLQLGLGVKFANHSVNERDDGELPSKAWNLPDLKANITGDYKITEKWNVGAELFYVGDRKDFIFENHNPKVVKAKGFLDANLRVNYQLNDQIGFFVKGNNLLNDNYDSWYNYKVQGIQGMIGLSYQF